MPSYLVVHTVPKSLHPVANLLVTKNMRRNALSQGLRVYTDKEILDKASDEWEALSLYLGYDKSYFMGDDKITPPLMQQRSLAGDLCDSYAKNFFPELGAYG